MTEGDYYFIRCRPALAEGRHNNQADSQQFTCPTCYVDREIILQTIINAIERISKLILP